MSLDKNELVEWFTEQLLEDMDFNDRYEMLYNFMKNEYELMADNEFLLMVEDMYPDDYQTYLKERKNKRRDEEYAS